MAAPREKIRPGSHAAYRRLVLDARAGGVLGFSSCSPDGAAINLCTWGIPGWGLSHIAIVADHPFTHLPVLWESTSLCELDCLIQSKRICGVQAHPILARIRSYRGKVWYYPPNWLIGDAQSQRLTSFLFCELGRAYDFRGAFDSRATLMAWLLRHYSREDLRREFCSELVAAALRRIGWLATDNCSAWSPNRLARHLVRQQIFGRPWRVQ